MGGIYRLDGLTPVVAASAFVHPDACLIGDVVIGDGVYVGPFASLRGDFGRIEVRAGANVQDHCMLHCFPGALCLVEEDGHLGHGCILHGCTVGRNALVGMNAVVMDGAVIGESAVIAANAFVPGEFAVPPRHLAAGTPAKVRRELTESEIAWKRQGTAEYQELARRSAAGLEACTPLRAIEPNRPRLTAAGTQPLKATRRSD
ncbi:MAG: phenylacetic acid degradation protein PaaY [Geminicoccaceae bacterium]|nr:MAG: phenylacetic acid degradation protein PaaY [Geminicoccaceae bacterium]